ncbi:MAG: ABC transporter permease, partial [Spirochaetota bacterium]
MIASYRKELYSFIATPYGVVFAAGFLLLSGLATALGNLFSQDSHFESTTLALLPWFVLLLLPLLTMRSLADEQA